MQSRVDITVQEGNFQFKSKQTHKSEMELLKSRLELHQAEGRFILVPKKQITMYVNGGSERLTCQGLVDDQPVIRVKVMPGDSSTAWSYELRASDGRTRDDLAKVVKALTTKIPDDDDPEAEEPPVSQPIAAKAPTPPPVAPPSSNGHHVAHATRIFANIPAHASLQERVKYLEGLVADRSGSVKEQDAIATRRMQVTRSLETLKAELHELDEREFKLLADAEEAAERAKAASQMLDTLRLVLCSPMAAN